MPRFVLSLFAAFVLLIANGSAQQSASSPANISVPNLIRYGGILKDAQGAPVVSATMGVTFAIYKQQDGGAPLWMETQNVTTDAAGNYNVVLGSTTASGLPGGLFSQQEQRWLGVEVQGEAEQPRVLLVSVPYAFKAHDAETLGGRSVSDFVLANNPGSAASSSANQPQAAGSVGSASPSTTTRKLADSAGPTNFLGSTGDQIVGVTQSSTGVGVNAMAPGTAVLATSTATGAVAIHGVAIGKSGYGLLGEATFRSGTGIGVKGSSSSPTGTGVRGIDNSTTGATTGISAFVNSTDGIAGVFNNASGGKILSAQNNGTEMFSVDGGGNVNLNFVSATYMIGGNRVLGIGTPTGGNLFVGVQAGMANSRGTANVFAGYQAGIDNNSGNDNVFTGYQTGYSNTTGKFNTYTGATAGYTNDTGSNNAFYGAEAGYNSEAACCNTFAGTEAGYYNTSGLYGTYFGYQAGSGVIVARVVPGSPADDAGVQPGDLIRSVNRQPVTSTDQFGKAVAEAKKSGSALLLIQRGEFSQFIVVQLSQ